MRRFRIFLIFLFFCFVSLGSGCSVFIPPKKDISKFYTFRSYGSPEKVSDSSNHKQMIINLTVGEIPSYADYPYIVTISTHNRLVLSEINRWAEPLQDACARTLTNELSKLMCDYALIIPSSCTKGNSFLYDYVLSIGLSDFIYDEEEKKVTLECVWSLINFATKSQVLIHEYKKSTPSSFSDGSYKDIVDTMELALYELAQDIAAKVGQIFPETELK